MGTAASAQYATLEDALAAGQSKDELEKSYVSTGWVTKTLPAGVVGEHIQGYATTDMEEKTPEKVVAFMEEHKAEDCYARFAKAMVAEAKTSGFFGKKYDLQKGEIVKTTFDDEFGKLGINVFLCSHEDLLKTDYGVPQKWIEFVDTSLNPKYAPAEVYTFQAKVTTGWGSKKLPNGVVGEHIQGYKTTDIAKQTPVEVEEFMKEHSASELYHKFAETMVAEAKNKGFFGDSYYDTKKMEGVGEQYGPEFEKLGIKVFLCSTDDTLKTDAGVTQKWIEYVDVAKNPDYEPAEKDGEKMQCAIC